MLPCHGYCIYETWRNILVGEYFIVIWRASHKRMGHFLWGVVDPLRHHEKIVIWQLEEG